MIFHKSHPLSKLVIKHFHQSNFHCGREQIFRNKNFTDLKNVNPRTEKKNLKEKVLENAGNLFNHLYYIYKNKYNKEINSSDRENKKKPDYKKLRLTDDYQYPSEEETSEKSTKTDFDELNEQIIKEETEINKELFINHFSFQKPTDMLKKIIQFK